VAIAGRPEPMATFSEDVLSRILRELDVATLARAGLACQAWRAQVWGRAARGVCFACLASGARGLLDRDHGGRWRE
jgi:hypothetical protein